MNFTNLILGYWMYRIPAPRHHVWTLPLALVVPMSFISCSTSDTNAGLTSMRDVRTSRVITVLQDPW
ncbi:MAG: hypothetical protein O7G85_15325 [Planctomycetota bacterium]|nr:hypothetical protein [Planctomycetota bacterium]